jgi:hypothetical protein
VIDINCQPWAAIIFVIQWTLYNLYSLIIRINLCLTYKICTSLLVLGDSTNNGKQRTPKQLSSRTYKVCIEISSGKIYVHLFIILFIFLTWQICVGCIKLVQSIQLLLYNTNTDKIFVIFHCQTVKLKLGKRCGLSASNRKIEIVCHWWLLKLVSQQSRAFNF